MQPYILNFSRWTGATPALKMYISHYRLARCIIYRVCGGMHHPDVAAAGHLLVQHAQQARHAGAAGRADQRHPVRLREAALARPPPRPCLYDTAHHESCGTAARMWRTVARNVAYCTRLWKDRRGAHACMTMCTTSNAA